jgi:hypothetical protein
MKPRGPGNDKERRADPRRRVTCRVEVTVGVPCCGTTSVTDLSAGGCFVKCSEAVQKGEIVKLLFLAGGAHDLTVWGDVTHVESGGFGLRFTAFSRGGARDLLASVLAGEGRGD